MEESIFSGSVIFWTSIGMTIWDLPYMSRRASMSEGMDELPFMWSLTKCLPWGGTTACRIIANLSKSVGLHIMNIIKSDDLCVV